MADRAVNHPELAKKETTSPAISPEETPVPEFTQTTHIELPIDDYNLRHSFASRFIDLGYKVQVREELARQSFKLDKKHYWVVADLY
ncbi:MAG: hypothetical protein LBL93_05525 [Ruminococcus sp.]|jgi:hypothetical protein|nr:hypothetical protein [Ruminococcus sp.]